VLPSEPNSMSMQLPAVSKYSLTALERHVGERKEKKKKTLCGTGHYYIKKKGMYNYHKYTIPAHTYTHTHTYVPCTKVTYFQLYT
jgi:DNA/RNA endonuclease G (NUC1)